MWFDLYPNIKLLTLVFLFVYYAVSLTSSLMHLNLTSLQRMLISIKKFLSCRRGAFVVHSVCWHYSSIIWLFWGLIIYWLHLWTQRRLFIKQFQCLKIFIRILNIIKCFILFLLTLNGFYCWFFILRFNRSLPTKCLYWLLILNYWPLDLLNTNFVLFIKVLQLFWNGFLTFFN